MQLSRIVKYISLLQNFLRLLKYFHVKTAQKFQDKNSPDFLPISCAPHNCSNPMGTWKKINIFSSPVIFICETAEYEMAEMLVSSWKIKPLNMCSPFQKKQYLSQWIPDLLGIVSSVYIYFSSFTILHLWKFFIRFCLK